MQTRTKSGPMLAKRRVMALAAAVLGTVAVGLVSSPASAATEPESSTYLRVTVNRADDEPSWDEEVTFTFASDCPNNLQVLTEHSNGPRWSDLDGFSVGVVTQESLEIGKLDPSVDCNITVTSTAAIGTVTPSSCTVAYDAGARWLQDTCEVDFADDGSSTPISTTDPVTVSDIWLDVIRVRNNTFPEPVTFTLQSDCPGNMKIRQNDEDGTGPGKWNELDGYTLDIVTQDALEIGKLNPLTDCTIAVNLSTQIGGLEARVCAAYQEEPDPKCMQAMDPLVDLAAPTTNDEVSMASCSIASPAISKSIRADAKLPVYQGWLDSCAARVWETTTEEAAAAAAAPPSGIGTKGQPVSRLPATGTNDRLFTLLGLLSISVGSLAVGLGRRRRTS